jgi:hypothetical protein
LFLIALAGTESSRHRIFGGADEAALMEPVETAAIGCLCIVATA